VFVIPRLCNQDSNEMKGTVEGVNRMVKTVWFALTAETFINMC